MWSMVVRIVLLLRPAGRSHQRSIYKVRLDDGELALKRRMLGTFVSQNGPSLAQASAYPDRLVEWRPRPFRSRPFKLKDHIFAGSWSSSAYCRDVLSA